MKIKHLSIPILILLSACANAPEPLATEVVSQETVSVYAPAQTPTEPEEIEETEILEPEPEPLPDPVHIRLQFAGDILLHGGLGAQVGDGTFNYRPFMWAIAPHINGDLNLVNMETPVDVFGNNHSIQTWPLFNAPFEILDGLIYAGFNHLITANNHSLDMRWSGLEASLLNFERAGISQTGMYASQADFDRPTLIEVGGGIVHNSEVVSEPTGEGILVGVIAYTDSFNGLDSWVPADNWGFAPRRFRSHVLDDIPAMAQDIADIRDAGAELVVISLHWGAEYVNQPTATQREIARALVDAGADIIMGHHAHVPQPVEWHYRADGTRGFIIYSLGNFLSDQIALGIPATQYGMLVTVYAMRDTYGVVSLYNAYVLPTAFVRDSGRTLGSPYSILPVIGAQVPASVASQSLRDWGTRAYNHVRMIVGEEFIYTGEHNDPR